MNRNKTQARQRIRQLKNIIQLSNYRLQNAIAQNHYKVAESLILVISNNFKELNSIRSKLKRK
jgi:hypothetical protein